MDKKNLTIGVLLLIAAFASMFLSQRLAPPPPPAPEIAPIATGTAPEAGAPSTSTPVYTPPSNATFAAMQDVEFEAKERLVNEFIEVRLSNVGGAVQEVAMKKYPITKDQPAPFVFNAQRAGPIFGLTAESRLGPAIDPTHGLNTTPFEVVSATSTEVVYRTVLNGELEITRRYRLPSGEDPYRIHHETVFRNLSNKALAPQPVLSLGTAALVDANDVGQYLNVTTYNGEDANVIDRGDLEGGGFFSNFGIGNRSDLTKIDRNETVIWAAITNQFFASIYQPDTPGVGVVAKRVQIKPPSGVAREVIGLTAATRIQMRPLGTNDSETISGKLYIGPKEYDRISRLDHNQDQVMRYTRFPNNLFLSGFVAPMMNKLMGWTQKLVGNWGWAIVLMTLTLKIVTLPLTFAASRSAKRMQKIQPEMQAVREKYKDNPQKLQAETMAIFKKHKINPVGGCLPILATMPLFFGFFTMLLSAAELRFQEFLWVDDLSAPDTEWRVWGFPINIMPVLMGATMIIQMRLVPQPSVDNAQAKMFKFMPYIFAIFCYNFGAALALYSTINGLFTIGQQLVINRMKDDVVLPTAGVAAANTAATVGKAMKNVTPQKKKKK